MKNCIHQTPLGIDAVRDLTNLAGGDLLPDADDSARRHSLTPNPGVPLSLRELDAKQ